MEHAFSKKGKFPSAALATPRAVDLNADGLLDLVVSAGENVFLFFNVGSKTQPLFAVHDKPLPSEWGSMPLRTFGLQFLDWDHDGRQDILSGLTIYLNQGNGDYRPVSLLLPGNRIEHPAQRGDAWMFTQLGDLDGDGRLDLLFGTNEGHVWVHRNLGGIPPRFDEKGQRLLLKGGKPIQVGPIAGQQVDFDVLQGARTAFAIADFDNDGLLDLVVGDITERRATTETWARSRSRVLRAGAAGGHEDSHGPLRS